ncbi:MAG: sugar phosphate isomerase/epimerase [Geminicoccaceae bacterium]|nr:sugar phosphate isomerase/epimerase [Geminicoccaceae bacterium]HRY27001.1 sugar phosphate isomerase/epimerase family protein [Geminicoccaceae bacterium]
MRTIKGPGIFLAQFIAPVAPYDRIETLAPWAAAKGYKGVQVPTFNPAVFDLEQAASSRTWCDEYKGLLAEHGLVISELSTHRQGHCVAVHPAYNLTIDAFTPEAVTRNPEAREAWAIDQLMKAAQASANLGLDRHVTFPGSLLWPYLYLYPPRPFGLIEEGFTELAKRWRPILDRFDELGIDVAYEIHPGEDLHDGLTFEMFLEKLDGHQRVTILYDPSHLHLQGMDYVGFLDVYGERIRAFHVKDAEYRMNARTGYWGGYQNWPTRAGRFRSPGDGQIDFGAIFSKLSELDYDGWASVEWECCIKHPDQGATEAAELIRRHIIQVQERAFDANMQAQGIDHARNRAALGLK